MLLLSDREDLLALIHVVCVRTSKPELETEIVALLDQYDEAAMPQPLVPGQPPAELNVSVAPFLRAIRDRFTPLAEEYLALKPPVNLVTARMLTEVTHGGVHGRLRAMEFRRVAEDVPYRAGQQNRGDDAKRVTYVATCHGPEERDFVLVREADGRGDLIGVFDDFTHARAAAEQDAGTGIPNDRWVEDPRPRGVPVRVSLTLDGVRQLKSQAFDRKPYVDRVSIALTNRVLRFWEHGIDSPFCIIDQLDFLDGIKSTSSTKPAQEFKHPPLAGFWHKHFFAVGRGHNVKNMMIRWGISGDGSGRGNKDWHSLFARVCKDGEIFTEQTAGVLAHELVLKAMDERYQRGFTGDWIIYKPHDGLNYYLELATHEEGKEPEKLYEKLVSACRAEYPFLFPDT
jgi:hypothetical protein